MSQRIDHTNYEAWLLDRLEGRLSPDENRALEAFLLAHPELDPGHDELPTLHDTQAALSRLEREALKKQLPPAGLVTAHDLDDHLVARLEGDLAPEQLQALRAFLLAHPEHARDERLHALARIGAEPVVLPGRAGLHRDLPPTGSPSLPLLDDFLVARLEGDLDRDQERALNALLAGDAQARRAWAAMAAARILPHQVEYPHKTELKRGARVIAIGAGAWMRRLAAAASIALLLGLGWWWQHSTSDAPNGLAAGHSPSRSAPAEPRPTESATEPLKPTVEDHQPPLHPDGPGAQPARRQRVPIKEPGQPPPQEMPQPLPEPQPQPQANEPLPPEPAPMDMAAQESWQTPLEAPVTAANPLPRQRDGAAAVPTLRQALASALRERVLESAADPARPLDVSDAEAATNRVLRTVAGEEAAFAVRRDAMVRSKGFELRLGRHLALSARR